MSFRQLLKRCSIFTASKEKGKPPDPVGQRIRKHTASTAGILGYITTLALLLTMVGASQCQSRIAAPIVLVPEPGQMLGWSWSASEDLSTSLVGAYGQVGLSPEFSSDDSLTWSKALTTCLERADYD